MKIERLAPDDWARFRKIRMASLQESPEAFSNTFADAESRTEAAWRQQLAEMPTFLAVWDGADVGVVRGSIDEQDASRAFLHVPEHRRVLKLGSSSETTLR